MCFAINFVINYFQKLETDVEEIQPSFRVGSVIFLTDKLKMSLVTETRNWKMAYAKALNERCGREMDSVTE